MFLKKIFYGFNGSYFASLNIWYLFIFTIFRLIMSKIALVQFKASLEKEKNLPKILGYIKQAAKNNAEMVTFPEYMMFYTPSTQTAKQVAQEAETINGEFVSAVAQSAKDNSCLLYTSPSPRDRTRSRMPSSA